MAQEYEITSIDAGKEPFIDQNGNTWITAVFLGFGEPVKWVVKDVSKFKVGDTVYGRIEEVPTKKDPSKTYNRFYREAKPETSYVPDKEDKPTAEYWDNKQSQIKAQWAIGQAVQLHVAITQNGGEETQSIFETAKEMFAMVDRVANPIDENDVDIINLKDIPI